MTKKDLDLPDMTAAQYKLKYYAFNTKGDPMDPLTLKEIHDPIYEALKKRDARSKLTFLTKRHRKRPRLISSISDKTNGSWRKLVLKSIIGILLLLGLTKLITLLIQFYLQ